jgi:hypothetical protein
MRTALTRTLGALAAGLGAVLATPVAAQLSTTANGPYYAMPSWAQKLTTNRFVVLANWNHEAVLDRETGLVWERTPQASLPLSMNWFSAHQHCNDLTVAGRKGWRVPALQELASLVDPTIAAPGPTLPGGHPFLEVPFTAWSATISSGSAANAWRVRFTDADVAFFDRSASRLQVWCVRGGQGADAQ